MKKLVSLTLSVFLLAALLLGACGTPAPALTASPEPTTAPTAAPAVTDAPESAEPPATPLPNPVSVDLATPELLGPYYLREGCEEFDEFNDPDYQRIVLMADETVTDLRYIPIEFAGGDETVSFKAGEALYTLPELTPEKPLVIAWMEVGLFPYRAVAFTDAAGAERVFALIMSGEDGSMLLMELVEDADGSYVPLAAE